MPAVLPAYAGMIRRRPEIALFRPCAPRVCGDDPCQNLVDAINKCVLPAYAGMIRRRAAHIP